MERILITGATGFIGSHLTELLVQKGHEVTIFAHYNSNGYLGNLENNPVLDQVKILKGDIRDYDAVRNAVKGVDVIFHLAALIGIPYSYISPKAYIETNITGTYNILQAGKEESIEQIIVTSTSETYGTAQYVPIDEKHPMNAQSPYAASKIGADQMALSFYRSFDLPVKIVRPFNTYGPRQSLRAIIPTVIGQILSGNNKIKLGNISPTRDLTFVKDTCKGFHAIFKEPKCIGEITNIGMNKEISIGELVKYIGKLMNVDVEIITDDIRLRPKKSEVERLLCDNKKIVEYTNWSPDYNLEKGLIEAINYYKEKGNIFRNEYNV